MSSTSKPRRVSRSPEQESTKLKKNLTTTSEINEESPGEKNSQDFGLQPDIEIQPPDPKPEIDYQSSQPQPQGPNPQKMSPFPLLPNPQKMSLFPLPNPQKMLPNLLCPEKVSDFVPELTSAVKPEFENLRVGPKKVISAQPGRGKLSSRRKSKRRCERCKKALGICQERQCRCGFSYCVHHIHFKDHDCQFNYLKSEREKLRQEMQPVVSDKIQKL